MAVGNEVLFGDTLNTNGAYLARRLRELGGEVLRQEVVPDDLEDIVEASRRLLRSADLVLLVGGLGPTGDDLTREGLARATGRPLVLDRTALQGVQAFFAERRLPMPDSNRRQALFPEGSVPLANRRGTAPGVFLPMGDKVAAALPGPPGEMEDVFEEALVPRIRERFPTVRQVVWLRLAGIGESLLEERLADLMGPGNPSLLPYAKRGEVHLRLASEARSPEEARAVLDARLRQVTDRVGPYIYGTGETTFEEAVVGRLRERGQTVACQESATGGWLAKRLTDPPGASDVFLGGTVVYTVGAKETLGGLPEAQVLAQGPVSRETAEGLAGTIRERLRTTWGLAICGWAGPTGEGPVGLGFVALAGPDGIRSDEVRAPGLRDDVRFRLTQAALLLLWKTTREGQRTE